MSSGAIASIRDLITPSLEAAGYEIVRIRMTGADKPTLQIMAERAADGGMDVDNCEEVSRMVSALLDVEDPIREAYTLEVSSPGVDRPLTREKDFRNFAGHEVKIELDRMRDGRKRFRGELLGVTDGQAMLRLQKDEEEAGFPLEQIRDAKLVMTDKLIEQSLRKHKARTKQEEAE